MDKQYFIPEFYTLWTYAVTYEKKLYINKFKHLFTKEQMLHTHTQI